MQPYASEIEVAMQFFYHSLNEKDLVAQTFVAQTFRVSQTLKVSLAMAAVDYGPTPGCSLKSNAPTRLETSDFWPLALTASTT